MKKIIILDRDGVINTDRVDYVKSLDEWEFIPGSIQAISDLTQAGYQIFVATNQSGIAKGVYSEDTLSEIHDYFNSEVEKAKGKIEGIYYCPHHDADNCDCRKPLPGLLHRIARDAGQSIDNVPFVGDALRDVQAALSKGCKPVLVLTGKGKATYELLIHQGLIGEVSVYDDLFTYTQTLLTQG